MVAIPEAMPTLAESVANNGLMDLREALGKLDSPFLVQAVQTLDGAGILLDYLPGERVVGGLLVGRLFGCFWGDKNPVGFRKPTVNPFGIKLPAWNYGLVRVGDLVDVPGGQVLKYSYCTPQVDIIQPPNGQPYLARITESAKDLQAKQFFNGTFVPVGQR